jgi:DNA-binding PadR family transcriptional regulator
VEKVYRLTSKGRKVARNVLPSKRDSILDFLYNNGSGTAVDISNSSTCTVSESEVKSKIVKYASKDIGLVEVIY